MRTLAGILILAIFFWASGVILAQIPPPPWWPGPSEFDPDEGMEWPPPKPDDWARKWPPGARSPLWWFDHFRRRNHGVPGSTAGDPRKPVGNGHKGYRDFVFAFGAFDERKPHCGFSRIHRLEEKEVVNCQPFPAAEISALCEEAQKSEDLRDKCSASCDLMRSCSDSRLHEPALFVEWTCGGPVLPGAGAGIDVKHATCRTVFLCECKR